MSDLISGQRTFFLGVSSLGVGSTTTVPFVDTAGNVIKCNYVSITAARDSAGVGMVGFELSGPSRQGDMVVNGLTIDPASPETSSILGFGGVVTQSATEKFVWHGSNGELASAVKIRAGEGGAVVGITFGNIKPWNMLRDYTVDDGV
jgi:hypothetical protein